MNKKDRKIFHFLSLSQGVYYCLLGISIGFVLVFNPAHSRPFTPLYDSGVIAGLLIGVGCSLYKSRGFIDPRNSIFYLGFICAVTFLINHIISNQSSILQFADLLIQTVFLLLWTYLLYWRWVIGEFLKLSSRRKKTKHKSSSERHEIEQDENRHTLG
jgi:hypothetical protein